MFSGGKPDTALLIEKADMDRFIVNPASIQQGEKDQVQNKDSAAFTDNVLEKLMENDHITKDGIVKNASSLSRFNPSHNIKIINVAHESSNLYYRKISHVDHEAQLSTKSGSAVTKCCLMFALGLILALLVILIVSTILLKVPHGHGHRFNHLYENSQTTAYNSNNSSFMNVTLNSTNLW